MDDKEFYLDAIRDIVPENETDSLQNTFYSFLELEHLYDSAIELVKTQLNSACAFKEIQFIILKAALNLHKVLLESYKEKDLQFLRNLQEFIYRILLAYV